MKLNHEDVDYVDDRDSAARLHLELKRQHAQQLRDGKRGSAQQTQRAINKLAATWPDAGQHAATATSDQLGGLSPELKKVHAQVRREHGHTADTARKARRGEHPRKPPAKGPKNPRTERRGGQSRGAGRRAGARSSLRGPARRAWTGTGVPATVGSYRDLLLQVIGFGLLATLGYDLLTGRGPNAVQAAAGGVATFVRAIVAPVDPLRVHAATVKTTTTAAAATPTTESGIPLDWTPRLANYPDSHRTPPHRAPLFTNPLAIPTIGGTP